MGSHGVHEGLLDLVEDDDAEGEEDEHEDEAVGEPAPTDEVAGTEEAVLEGLDDAGDGIERHDGVEVDAGHDLVLHLAEGIDDRGGVHPELHDEGEEDLEVAVLGGHGADEDAEAQRQAGHHQHQHGEQQGMPRKVGRTAGDGIDGIDHHEQPELDGETQQIAEDIRDRHHQTREIDLAEDAGVLDEGVGGGIEAVGEVLPHAHASQVEQRLGHAVGGDTGNAAKHHHVHDDRQRRLDDVPQRPEDGLLILHDDVTLHKERAEVAVAPQLTKINRQQLLLRFDDNIPIFFHTIHTLNQPSHPVGDTLRGRLSHMHKRQCNGRTKRFNGQK